MRTETGTTRRRTGDRGRRSSYVRAGRWIAVLMHEDEDEDEDGTYSRLCGRPDDRNLDSSARQ